MSERRLHPAAAVAGAAEQLRGLAVPIIIAAVVGGGAGGGRFLFYGLIGVGIALVGGVVSWQTERYWVDDHGVHHRHGVLRKQQTTIPIERVQGVDTVRGPVQRLFGVLELRIQSAGGSAGEVALRALTPADADALRAALRLAGARPAVEDEETAPPPERRLTMGSLLVTAATAGQIGVLLPVVAAASQLLDDVGGSGDAARALVPRSVAGALGLAGAVIVLAWLISFGGAIVAFAGFTVTRDGDRLRIRRGLLQRRESAIPVSRIAAVRLVESPLRQPFGLAELRLESAGYGDDPRAARTLFPLVEARAAGALLAEVLPEHALPAVALAGAPGRARRRYLLWPVAASAVVAVVLVAVFGAVGLLGLLLVAGAVAFGLAGWRAAGAAVSGERVVLRRRRLARTTLVADARRLQHVERVETVLTRRAGLASVGVGVASGTVVEVRLLDASVADGLVARLAALAR